MAEKKQANAKHEAAVSQQRVPLPREAQSRLQELLEGLSRAKDLVPVTQTEHLKGNTKPPFVDIHDPGYVRSSRKATEAARRVAEWRSVPQNFEALRALYSESMQVFVCIPEARYLQGDPRLCEVDWSRDETEFRVDMYNVLAEYNWETPDGMIRQVDVYAVQDLPGHGPVLLLDVPAGELRPKRKSRSRKRQEQERTPSPGGVAERQAGTRAGRSSRAAPDWARTDR